MQQRKHLPKQELREKDDGTDGGDGGAHQRYTHKERDTQTQRDIQRHTETHTHTHRHTDNQRDLDRPGQASTGLERPAQAWTAEAHDRQQRLTAGSKCRECAVRCSEKVR